MYPKLAQQVRTRLRSVAANHHHTIDASLGEVANRLGPAAFLAEFRTSSAAKERAAELDDAAHVARTELSELIVDQALPTLAHAIDRHPLIERTTRNGTYGRIHAGGITTTRKDRDVLHESDIMNLYPASPLNQTPSPRATKAGKAGSKLAARAADSGHQNDWTGSPP